MEEMNLFVGRQPILDKVGNIFGYELLYRNSEENSFPDVDPEKATIGVLINTFLSIGIDKIAGNNRVFINFSGKLLEEVDFLLKLNSEKVVIEILEDVEISPSVLNRLRKYKKKGFTIALDDFTVDPSNLKHYKELFKLVDIIKIDFLNTTPIEQKEYTYLKRQYPNITLLAEKVESVDQRNYAEKLGYELFQGYFFAKPEIIKGIEISSNITLHTYILNLLYSEMPDLDKIADLMMRDISLTYKLLRYINSMAFDIPNKISSIKQALVLLGAREIRKWMQILMFYEMGEGESRGSIKALVEYSLVRAKMCELIARRKQKTNIDEYFLAGMFSMIDVIVSRSKEEILPLLHLSDEVTKTLFGKFTKITPYLRLVIAIEEFDWKHVHSYSEQIGITEVELSQFSQEAYRWVHHFE